jgi:hypothetical protein
MTQSPRRTLAASAILAAALAVLALYWLTHRVTYVPGSSPQQAYVTTAAPAVLGTAGDSMDELLFTAADFSVSADQCQTSPKSIDYAFIAQHHLRIGLVLNIALSPVHAGVFAPASAATHAITAAAQSILQAAKQAGVQIAELQITCTGCDEYPRGFETWLTAVSSATNGSTPITVACPPRWLDDSNFAAAARASQGFVVQIPPGQTAADIQACAHRAAKWKFPFRPAINTANADPAAMAQLIQSWKDQHPQNMTAILWSALAADDEPNWRWPTLHSVINGITPQPKLLVATRKLEPRLSEIDLINTGDADATTAADVSVTWSDSDLDDAQALAGYQRQETGRYSQTLHAKQPALDKPLRPGERRAIGWVRLTDDAPVQAQFAPASAAAAQPHAN